MKDKEKRDKHSVLGRRILENCRNGLYHDFPYLDGAFTGVSYEASPEMEGIGTEGNTFYFQPEFLLRMYADNPARVRRGYLHMLLHCLYLHLFPDEKKDLRLWNLACDMAVEQILEKEKIRLGTLPENPVKEACFRQMPAGLSAEKIYDMLEKKEFSPSIQKLEQAFAFDNHSLWYTPQAVGKRQKTRKKWEMLLTYTTQNRKSHKRRAGTKKGTASEDLGEIQKGRYDYRKFLKRFAVLREEMELDTESFDYIFYHYGMKNYGNIPLIEPLEYKEGNKLEELVIAIDTSGSCSKDTVQQFLEETYSILSEKENFFSKMKVYIIQCDCYVQDVAVIHSEEEWKIYSKNVKIQGRSGTDFRPVFRCVQELQEKKELRNLRALIYFTDGDGIYPRHSPGYETAFVFLKKTEAMNLVPPWAVRLLAFRIQERETHEY